MPYLIDETVSHVMHSHVTSGRYVTLAWPKDCTLRELDYCKEVVNLQLDVFRREAIREADADAEFQSWLSALRTPQAADQS